MRINDLEFLYRCADKTVSLFVRDVCEAIYNQLQPAVLAFPNKEEWQFIVDGFKEHWQIPNCLGTLGGKHVRIGSPQIKVPTYYLNHNSTHLLLWCWWILTTNFTGWR